MDFVLHQLSLRDLKGIIIHQVRAQAQHQLTLDCRATPALIGQDSLEIKQHGDLYYLAQPALVGYIEDQLESEGAVEECNSHSFQSVLDSGDIRNIANDTQYAIINTRKDPTNH
ncbi:MAG: hypothetical protein EZS28_038387 [Streblomastix strix]|uniref:Uncharacterized protein n=1 Tax=Streblomastix strix TaxID=222440 RepID=A0A5J4U5H3_9EUKA|nr:MAG: hypothetical protein EZS28_038387 [Streblomastix strix]